jgi:endonuclease/exonuclease/phosphatase family metal-dependent hydrolase
MTTFARRWLRRLLAVLLAVAAVRLVAVAAVLPWWAHDPLVYFPTLFYAVPGLLLAGGLRWRKAIPRALLWTAVAILGLNVVADVRPPRRSPDHSPGQELRLLSFNLYQARLADGEILDLVRERGPHILCLQEVPAQFFEAHEGELRQTFRHVHYHRQLLVASNCDVTAAEAVELPHARSLQHLILDVRGTRLDVFNTHLTVANPGEFFTRLREQQRQTDALLDHFGAAPGLFVAAGDFNMPLHSTGYKRLTASYQSARSAAGSGFGYTFNAFLPVTTIDHCFGSDGIEFLRCEPLTVRLSDHRPLEVEFAVPAAAP